MNFLEARRILTDFAGGPDLPFVFATSGLADPFRLYLNAAAARLGRAAVVTCLPFGTLRQHLESGPSPAREIFLLLPWDFVPESDWRTGVPAARVNVESALAGAERVASLLQRRVNAHTLHLPAPIPPLAGFAAGDRALADGIQAAAASIGARLLPPDAFSLGSYFASGCPVGGDWLGRVAEAAIEEVLESTTGTAKVLVTDLDNTLWGGVIAEDGPEGIAFRPDAAGFRHFVFQGLLARLRREGALLAAVSRNDPAVVLPPFKDGRMLLKHDDFVAIHASYHAKSAQIAQLARSLNLGLDAFVFVDDNPVEREEVSRALPKVTVMAFPEHDAQLAPFLRALAARFEKRALTAEDEDRTALYRRRMEGTAPVAATGADLTSFLAGLGMRLTLHDRSTGDRTRAVQLINKTNQFNANGQRWTEAEVAATLAAGGRLYGGSLADRTGSHGEVLSLLLGPDGIVESFVMSCRVFQRCVEHAFLASLIRHGAAPTAIRFAATERNGPFQTFLEDASFGAPSAGSVPLNAAGFASAHAAAVGLFEVAWD